MGHFLQSGSVRDLELLQHESQSIFPLGGHFCCSPTLPLSTTTTTATATTTTTAAATTGPAQPYSTKLLQSQFVSAFSKQQQAPIRQELQPHG